MSGKQTPVIAIRPEPGLSKTLALACDRGLAITGEALFEIRPLNWQLPHPGSVDALLIGSANAFLGNAGNLAQLCEKPVYAVGKTTADAARLAGFEIAATGTGGLQNVLEEIAPPKRLLRIAGAEHVPLTAPKGVSVRTVIAYESVNLPLPSKLAGALADRPVVLLHSAAAAAHFAHECRRLGLDRGSITIAALGPRIASAAGQGWRAIHVAASPNDAFLLEMVHETCL